MLEQYRKDIAAKDKTSTMFEAYLDSSTAYTITSAPFSIELQGRYRRRQKGIQGVVSIRRTCGSRTSRHDIRIVGDIDWNAPLLTSYRLEYYYSLQTWPEQVRTPLKAAIKARNSGDFDRSESYFRK